MQGYIGRVLPMIVQFFRVKYKSMSEPSGYYFIPEGQVMQSACQDENGGHLVDANAYEYCPVDYNIYLGQAYMWHLYDKDGDAAPAVGLVHEWGHNVQLRAGVPEPANNLESVNHENQADCIAGAWIQYAYQQNWIEPEDVGSIARLIVDIASSEPNRDHGNLQERSNSMLLGLESGLQACNSFYPATPIIVS
jgi:predicted metalloprotease